MNKIWTGFTGLIGLLFSSLSTRRRQAFSDTKARQARK
jgi:hypothetical protein